MIKFLIVLSFPSLQAYVNKFNFSKRVRSQKNYFSYVEEFHSFSFGFVFSYNYHYNLII